MADDDAPPTASASAPRSAWVDDPPFPPLPRDSRRVSPAEVVVEAVAVRLAEGPVEAAPPQRTANQRRATPAEHLFMLRRYDDENPQEQFRIDVIHTCIAAAYPDAVAGDVRYVSAMKWFRQLEVLKPGDESSGGVLSDASKRSAALARLQAEVEQAKQRVAEALVKKMACEERARIAASKVAETAAKRAAKIAHEAAQRSQEEARRSRAQSALAAAAAAPQEMPRARGSGVTRSANVDAGDDVQLRCARRRLGRRLASSSCRITLSSWVGLPGGTDGGPKAFPSGANAEQQKALDRRVFKTPYLRTRLYSISSEAVVVEKGILKMNSEEINWSADPSNVALW